MKSQEIIKKYYYNPSTGFQSANKLYKKIHEKYPGISLKQIKDFISEQSTHQIHAPQKIPLSEYNQIRAPSLGELQLDLLDLSNYKRHNNGYRYILVVIDIYSRYSWVRPLKQKTGQEVSREMKIITSEITKHNINIWSFVMDTGKEFDNSTFNKYYSTVKMFRKSPDIHNSTGIVERRNSYIRSVLQKYFTAYHTLKWIDTLQNINDNVNNTINRTTKHTPLDIWNGREKNDEVVRDPPTQYNVGDHVRLLQNQKNFSKNPTGLFSNEVYIIIEKDGLGYRLNSIDRKVFGWELKKVDVSNNRRNILTRSSLSIQELRKNNKQQNTVNRRLGLL
jgi:hypothetical protein